MHVYTSVVTHTMSSYKNRFNNEGRDSAQGDLTGGLAVSPTLDSVIEASQVPTERAIFDKRTLRICALALIVGLAASFVAMFLMWLIAFVTNLAFYGRFSTEHASPAAAVEMLGVWVVLIPVIGGLIVGVMAKYGSRAIRGHGIPEAMEQVLTNKSKIPARVTILKPLSSAVAIGTGGPFGSEGPIIATGGALGSLVGQFTACSPVERKTLLGAGAAAGMAATFGSPIAAVLLAVELLLFEYRPRSIIPVALACTVATGIRIVFEGMEPAFHMPDIHHPATFSALMFYVLLGAFMGLMAALITRILYAVEDQFEKLPIHWMWWPAIGAVAVGVVGYFAPDTLGVGYYNISAILSNGLPVKALAFLCVMKFISWAIALGSGTSGGTLAPMLTIGGGIGALVGAAAIAVLPAAGIDIRIAALVGMASIFAGASRALLASAVFAFETTLQPMALLPLLGSCAAAYLASAGFMRNSIMTEKIARRGVQLPTEYTTDPLDHMVVRDVATKSVVTVHPTQKIADVLEWLESGKEGSTHQGFPVVDENETLVGIVTHRDMMNAKGNAVTISDVMAHMPRCVYEDSTVRQAADHMVNHDIGRLPVLSRGGKPRIVGILTRSDILAAYRSRIAEYETEAPSKTINIFQKHNESSDS